MKHLTFLLLIFTFFSCTSTKQVNKSESKTQSQEQTNTVLTQTVTETAKDTIHTKEVTSEAKTDVVDLLNGDSLVINTPEVITVVKVQGKKITAKTISKAQDIPVNINKVTVTNLTKSTDTKTKYTVKEKEKQKETNAPINWNWLWLIVAALIGFWLWRLGLFNKKGGG